MKNANAIAATFAAAMFAISVQAAAAATPPAAAKAAAPKAAANKRCAVSHQDCFPACIKLKADGSDCERTKTVCRDVCGPEPQHPEYQDEDKVIKQTPPPAAGKETPTSP